MRKFVELSLYLKKEYGLSNKKIADMLGITKFTMSNMMNGKHGCTGMKHVQSLETIIEIFNDKPPKSEPIVSDNSYCIRCNNAHKFHPKKGCHS